MRWASPLSMPKRRASRRLSSLRPSTVRSSSRRFMRPTPTSCSIRRRKWAQPSSWAPRTCGYSAKPPRVAKPLSVLLTTWRKSLPRPSNPASAARIGRWANIAWHSGVQEPAKVRYDRTMTLKGKIVFVTGASSGIGAATALAFAAEGARLLLAARRMDKLAAVAEAALKRGAQAVHSFSLDVRDRNAVKQAIEKLPAEWAAIDVLVNNAGLSRGLEKLYQGNIDDWDEMIDTNVKGLLYVTRAVVPGMVERDRGHVINLGSVAGEMTYPNGAVYCASKAAERAINDGLREDVLGTPIRVTSVDPGMVESEFSLVRFHGDAERAAKVYQNIKPLTPEDIAETIVWAASRPEHVNIARVVLTPVHQANALLFHRIA